EIRHDDLVADADAQRRQRREQADGAVHDHRDVPRADVSGQRLLELPGAAELGQPSARVEIVDDGLLLFLAEPRLHLHDVVRAGAGRHRSRSVCLYHSIVCLSPSSRVKRGLSPISRSARSVLAARRGSPPLLLASNVIRPLKSVSRAMSDTRSRMLISRPDARLTHSKPWSFSAASTIPSARSST